MGYKFCEKPDDITFDEIAETINVSFMDAVEKGIRFGIEKISGTELKKLLDDQNGKVFVALDNHQVVGTLSVVHKKTAAWYYKGDAMRFRLVAVLPEKAGQHIASELICCAKEYCKKNGAEIITVSTPANNKSAIHLYSKHLFSKVHYWWNKDHEVVDFAFWLNQSKPFFWLRAVHFSRSFVRCKRKKRKIHNK